MMKGTPSVGVGGEGTVDSMGEAIERAASAAGGGNGDTHDLAEALRPTRADGAPGRAETERAPAWEYRTELLEYGFFGLGKQQVDLRKLQDRLDLLGAGGWELVQVSWDHRVRRRHGGHLLFFKRPHVERSV